MPLPFEAVRLRGRVRTLRRAYRNARPLGRIIADTPPPQQVAPVLPVQHTAIPGTGLIVVYNQAQPLGDSFINAGGAVLNINNNGVIPITVTVIAQNACNQSFFHPLILVVPSGAQGAEMGPFDFHYQNLSTGLVQITYSSVLGLQVGVTAP